MQILIQKNGNQIGPFPVSQVAEMLESGQVTGTDLAWSEGMETWKPLSSFPQLKTVTPPPLPDMAPVLPSVRRTEPLSIWSLALGITSFIGCAVGGFLAGIPAVICGHIGLSKIKKDPSLDGKAMAIAGLITGYLGMLVFIPAIFFALAFPAVIAAKERAKATLMLSNMRQIHFALVQAQTDGKSTGDPKFGFPADANFTSADQVKKMLIENNLLTATDLAKLQFDKISIGNVSVNDPPDTITLQARSENGKLIMTVLKDGSGQLTRQGQPLPGQPPPRSPAFLQ